MKAWIVQQSNLFYELFLEEPIKDKYNWRWVYKEPFNHPPSLYDYTFLKKLIEDCNIEVTYNNSPIEININITL